jgi:hypothetical protein
MSGDTSLRLIVVLGMRQQQLRNVRDEMWITLGSHQPHSLLTLHQLARRNVVGRGLDHISPDLRRGVRWRQRRYGRG